MPRTALLALALLAVLALLPPLAVSYSQLLPQGTRAFVTAGQHPMLTCAISLAIAVGGLLIIEVLSSASRRAHAHPLRRRLSSILFHYDAALQRHLEGEPPCRRMTFSPSPDPAAPSSTRPG